MPALEFFESLGNEDQAKVLALFRMLGESGKISNDEKFKKLSAKLWEFKSFQVRFIGDFRPGSFFVIAIGLKKKRDRHMPKDLKCAEQILEEHDAPRRAQRS